MFFYEVNKDVKIPFTIGSSEILNKESAKKYVKLLSSFLKRIIKEDYYKETITSTFFLAMMGKNLDYVPRNSFCIYETEEEISSYKEGFIKDLFEYLEEKELFSKIQEDFGITLSPENLLSDIDKDFKERGYLLQNLGNIEEPIVNDVAIAIHSLIQTYLCGDIDSIFFINELL